MGRKGEKRGLLLGRGKEERGHDLLLLGLKRRKREGNWAGPKVRREGEKRV
jgi:hypothetical protein